MINEMRVGNGKVFLIAGGGKTYCDMAAKFCRTEKDVEDIIASPQSKKLIKDLVTSKHYAALEFDDFVFGIQGFARVTEVQMVRKRLASYLISSGRVEKNGKRAFNVVIPEDITKFNAVVPLNPERVHLKFDNANEYTLTDVFHILKNTLGQPNNPFITYTYNYMNILEFIETWYTTGVDKNIPEEDLRYMKPQATEFKAAIKIDAANLRNWARIRMCNRAQFEIRDLCTKMVNLAKEASPELMAGTGPSCIVDGYCSESEQCSKLKGIVPTKEQVLNYVNSHREEVLKG